MILDCSRQLKICCCPNPVMDFSSFVLPFTYIFLPISPIMEYVEFLSILFVGRSFFLPRKIENGNWKTLTRKPSKTFCEWNSPKGRRNEKSKDQLKVFSINRATKWSQENQQFEIKACLVQKLNLNWNFQTFNRTKYQKTLNFNINLTQICFKFSSAHSKT